jgi:hypothetical protein
MVNVKAESLAYFTSTPNPNPKPQTPNPKLTLMLPGKKITSLHGY